MKKRWYLYSIDMYIYVVIPMRRGDRKKESFVRVITPRGIQIEFI